MKHSLSLSLSLSLMMKWNAGLPMKASTSQKGNRKLTGPNFK